MASSKLVDTAVNVSNTPPADYSFRKLKSLKETEGVRPRSIRLGKEVTRGPTGKILSNSLWLNNNNLTSISYITDFVNNSFENPSKLEWLDFSFNQIAEISEEILKFKNLKILYLHGNCIENLATVCKLNKLKHLRNLTLYGNNIEALPLYRRYIIYFVPQIKNLDFVTISPREALAPEPTGATTIKAEAGVDQNDSEPNITVHK